jgi:hypothetical protein
VLRNILFLLVISLVISQPLQAQKDFQEHSLSESAVPASDMCTLAAAQMEDKFGIKEHLLQTISSVETGRWDAERHTFVAWPWTINVNGKGYYFKTKAEAVAKVRQLQQKGISGIDVGCMQISLKYHSKAFASLEDAFDPEQNVAYSAGFLAKLYRERGNWIQAAMAYHSKNPSHGRAYKNKLITRFEEVKVALLDQGEDKTLFD